MNILYIFLSAYIVTLLLVSYLTSRKQTDEDFFIGGRNRKGWQILLSKFAATIGAGYFITYTGFAYEYGFGVFAILLGMALGYLFFAYWAAPKIAAGSKEKKFYTIGHFVFDKTGSKASMYLADIFSSGILFAWLTVGIIGGAKIINDFGFLPYDMAVIITSLVILGYLLIAGYKAVILTDIVQSIVIFVLLIIVTFGIVGSENIFNILSVDTGNPDLGVIVGFLLFGALSVFSYSDRYQLVYAADNEKGLKHGLGLAIIPVLLVGAFLLLIGMFMAQKTIGLDTGLVFTRALAQFLSPKILPFAIVLFFAGIMSSADTNVYAISSHYVLTRNNRSIKSVRRSIIWLMVVVSLIAVLFPDVVKVSIFAGAVSLTLSFAMIYILCGGRNPYRFLGSALSALVALVVSIIFLGLEPVAAIPVLGAGALGLLWKIKLPIPNNLKR